MHEIFAKEDNLGDILNTNIDYVIDAIDTVSSKLSLISICKDKKYSNNKFYGNW